MLRGKEFGEILEWHNPKESRNNEGDITKSPLEQSRKQLEFIEKSIYKVKCGSTTLRKNVSMSQHGSFKRHLKAKKPGVKRSVIANQFNKSAKRNGFNGNCLKFIAF